MKNIVVFIDATPEGDKRADFAATLAHQHGAHIVGISVVAASHREHRTDYYVRGTAIKDALDQQKTADEIMTATVRQRFEALAAKRDVNAEFRAIRRGGPDEDLILVRFTPTWSSSASVSCVSFRITRLPNGSCSRAELRFSLYRTSGNPSQSAIRYLSAGTRVVRLGARLQMRCPSSLRLSP